jgi:hypothetical protein
MSNNKQSPQESGNSVPGWVWLAGFAFLYLLGAFSWHAKEFGLKNITTGSIIASFAASLVFSILWVVLYVLIKRRS